MIKNKKDETLNDNFQIIFDDYDSITRLTFEQINTEIWKVKIIKNPNGNTNFFHKLGCKIKGLFGESLSINLTNSNIMQLATTLSDAMSIIDSDEYKNYITCMVQSNNDDKKSN